MSSSIVHGLQEAGFGVDTVGTIHDAWLKANQGSWDVLVLDIALPDGSGIDLCSRLRASGFTAAILMLTARDGVASRVSGLEAGADDYLIKPFAFAELVARIRALARRPASLAQDTIVTGSLTMDIPARRVEVNNQEVRLTLKEFALLEILARHVGRVVDRPTITASVWDDNHDPFTNVLEVLVRRLRQKIDSASDTPVIETVRGAGYRLRK